MKTINKEIKEVNKDLKIIKEMCYDQIQEIKNKKNIIIGLNMILIVFNVFLLIMRS